MPIYRMRKNSEGRPSIARNKDQWHCSHMEVTGNTKSPLHSEDELLRDEVIKPSMSIRTHNCLRKQA